jgi:hypothetical protein
VKNRIEFAIIFFCLILTGCQTPSFDGVLILRPPEQINATFYGNNPTIKYKPLGFQGEGTIQVLGRIDSIKQYATSHHDQEGQRFQRHWFLVHCTVLKVEKGAWDHRVLIFPAFECEGGLTEFLSLEFIRGRFFIFGLRSTKKLPEIIYYQQRTRFPEHGIIEEPHWYYNSDDVERKKRITAVRKTFGIEDVRQSFSADRETQNFVVAETWLEREYNDPLTTVIDAQTYEAIPYEMNKDGEIIIIGNGQ